ncbi:MAG: OsmC family protein [Thermoanaerobacteraceae bacterium]|uniref:OsmC family protein n=1 Tax=Thermanaeromonas sp. C210 TaxID=2731925 RepID=UPI00155B8C33|nr:OsmC family protein [Thermanaeromonas sp. C210]MBE3581101.1 OsmC family protein [Thermoanaerobacteraceae bacterium]GFN22640.1 OsmC-like protein [Thermanaeromonas sp. C210]
MRVTVSWQGGMRLVGQGESGQEVTMDAAPEHGGRNEGARPSEVFLMGMAGCTALDVLSILGKKRVKVESFAVDVEAERADEHPRVFTSATLIYRLTGPDLAEEQVKHAIELSLGKYCAMVNTVKKAAPISYCYEINGRRSPVEPAP